MRNVIGLLFLGALLALLTGGCSISARGGFGDLMPQRAGPGSSEGWFTPFHFLDVERQAHRPAGTD